MLVAGCSKHPSPPSTPLADLIREPSRQRRSGTPGPPDQVRRRRRCGWQAWLAWRVSPHHPTPHPGL